jgi:hypothetical protein
MTASTPKNPKPQGRARKRGYFRPEFIELFDTIFTKTSVFWGAFNTAFCLKSFFFLVS